MLDIISGVGGKMLQTLNSAAYFTRIINADLAFPRTTRSACVFPGSHSKNFLPCSACQFTRESHQGRTWPKAKSLAAIWEGALRNSILSFKVRDVVRGGETGGMGSKGEDRKEEGEWGGK